MTFSLSAQFEEFIRSKLMSGDYDSPAQVIEDALLLLEERDHVRALREERLARELAGGVSQANNRQLIRAPDVFAALSNQVNIESARE